MARKGSEKTRTGCITCKKRRVKCDEAKPVCRKCDRGGRSCSYLEPPVGCLSWHHLLHARPSISPPPSKHLPPQHIRNLDYFRCVVAPALNGELGGTFWSKPVMQLAMSEDAAMHAMFAISMLYEGFEPIWKDARNVDDAMGHYNHALRMIATNPVQSSVALIVSVLFTCIEFLRGNTQAAVTHCRHGIILANASAQKDRDVASVIRQLSIVPSFFSVDDFPMPEKSAQTGEFEDLHVASVKMDEIMGRAIKFLRSLDSYRLGGEDLEVPPDTWETQQTILDDLDKWKATFSDLPTKQTDVFPISLLLMRFFVCYIWTNIAPHRKETASDKFQPEFAQIVILSQTEPPKGAQCGNFSFGMGTAPLLHFVVIKCRHLPTRLAALKALQGMNNRRESLWDSGTMYSIGQRIIEREHGVNYEQLALADESPFPADEDRIRDSWMEDDVYDARDEKGKPILRRRLWFFILDRKTITKEAHWVSVACC